MNPSAALRIAILSDHADQRFVSLVEKGFEKEGILVALWSTNGNDGVVEALDENSPLVEWAPDIALLNVCTPALRERFYSSEKLDRETSIDAFLYTLSGAVKKLRERGARVIMTTLAEPIERSFGNFSALVPSSFLAQVQRANHHIRHHIAGNDGVQLLDVEHLAALTGLLQWFDDRFWYHAKYPCNPRHIGVLAEQFISVILAGRGRQIKCIVLDLDNTLWGGVIGDDGLDGIILGGIGQGEAFRDFQRYLKVLKERGILLCVCSKNEEAAARLPFNHHDASALREDDFALFVANWQPKSVNIAWIASTLNIGRDSILFIDDSTYEREEVRRALPEVIVPDFPEDPVLITRMLETGPFFEVSTRPTDDDSKRTSQYRAENARRQLNNESGGIDDYLSSLNLTGHFLALSSTNLQRAAQLIQRSNQFNLRTQRLDEGVLRGFIDDPNRPSFCISLKDRFGDYGLISVICAEVSGEDLFLNEFVMSCRVLSRGVEQFICNALVLEAQVRGLKRVVGEYLPTEKNKLVADLYPKLGFVSDETRPGCFILYAQNYQPRTTFVNRD